MANLDKKKIIFFHRMYRILRLHHSAIVVCLNDTIISLDSKYCALRKDSQSWHLQNIFLMLINFLLFAPISLVYKQKRHTFYQLNFICKNYTRVNVLMNISSLCLNISHLVRKKQFSIIILRSDDSLKL